MSYHNQSCQTLGDKYFPACACAAAAPWPSSGSQLFQSHASGAQACLCYGSNSGRNCRHYRTRAWHGSLNCPRNCHAWISGGECPRHRNSESGWSDCGNGCHRLRWHHCSHSWWQSGYCHRLHRLHKLHRLHRCHRLHRRHRLHRLYLG